MIRGTSYQQDSRFADKNKTMLEKSQWPELYDTKIDLSVIDMELIKLWIGRKIQEVLGEDDDIISGTITSLLEQYAEKYQKPQAKQMHIAICGFLKDKTSSFMLQLWQLLNEAQHSPRGIPDCLLKEKQSQDQQRRKKLDEIKRKKDRLNGHRFDRALQSRDQRSREVSPKRRSGHSKERKKRSRKQRRESDSSESRHQHRDKRHKKHKNKKRRERSYSSDRQQKRRKPKDLESASESSEVISSS